MDPAERRRLRREFDDRQHEATRRIAALAYAIWHEWWRPLRNRHRRREVARLHAEAEQDYAAHMARDRQGRLAFRPPQS